MTVRTPSAGLAYPALAPDKQVKSNTSPFILARDDLLTTPQQIDGQTQLPLWQSVIEAQPETSDGLCGRYQ
ncbi:MAG: hypothetical protein CMP08_06555 [Xanthomonadales bacterium]|nr:hypothetical protein [Xanthomonadales bacterium]|tara:strand:+ start:3105 stop:3317 length:213 start_codon:yes stop_codon:yes gene_type:complete